MKLSRTSAAFVMAGMAATSRAKGKRRPSTTKPTAALKRSRRKTAHASKLRNRASGSKGGR